MSLLSLLIVTPMMMMALILMIPSSEKSLIYKTSLASSLISLLSCVAMTLHVDTGFFLTQQWDWIESPQIQFALAMDGLSLTLCLLNAVIMVIAVYTSRHNEKRVKAYFALLLILQTGIYGVFVSADLFLFYIFWEVTLIPLYFLIGIWGGPRREFAAIKFFIYTVVGSIFMLLAIVMMLYLNPLGIGFYFPLAEFHQSWLIQKTLFGFSMDKVLFLAFFFAFAVKIPVFPFHTWLPDAHVQAPTAISVILAGVLLKLGVYGLLRIGFGYFADAMVWFAPVLLIMGMINLLYGGLNAMVQKDLKRLIAYSSISHMGFCIMGLGAMTLIGLQGVVLQMVSHGLISAMLFLLVGYIYQRTFSLEIQDLVGLAINLPKLTFFAVFATFASIGLPGLSGFVSEWWVVTGTFLSTQNHSGWAVLAAIGAIFITAVYMLWTLQRVFLGPLQNKWSSLRDIGFEWPLFVLMILIVAIGLQPSMIIEWVNPSIEAMIGWVGQ